MNDGLDNVKQAKPSRSVMTPAKVFLLRREGRSLMPDHELTPVERIQSRIVVLRGQRVLLDADLVRLYGVPTKRSHTATGSQTHRDPRFLPYAFTEQGAIRTCHIAASYDLMP